MQFLHPAFLWALAALAIPVIVHLFNFRRYKTVYFSNVTFLKQVQQQTTSRSKLKHLLVLLARLLALAFLVLAFAQPFIPRLQNTTDSGLKYVSVFIDNSFSMNATGTGSPLFDKAKQAAKQIVQNYAPDDRFQLLSNSFDAGQQRLLSKQEFLNALEQLQIAPAVRTLTDIAKRQQDALKRENGTNQIVYIFSDFQTNMSRFTPDSAITYNLIPLAAEQPANVFIDTAWFTQPLLLLNQPLQLIVKITNSGKQPVQNNHLVLKINNQTKAMADFAIEPNSFIFDTLHFTLTQPNWNRAELQIQDYPITFDDTYYMAFNVISKINVLALSDNQPNTFLAALFGNQSEFNYTATAVSAFAPNSLSQYQLVLLTNLNNIPAHLSAALNTFISHGGTLAVFPPEKCDLESYNRFFNNLRAGSITGFSEQAQQMASLNLQHHLFKDVFERIPQNMSLPQVYKYYLFSSSVASEQEPVLTLKNGQSFFSHYPFGLGSLYVCAAPLDTRYTDLPTHAIFVPMLYKMAMLHSNSGTISYTIGDNTRIQIPATNTAADVVYKIKGDHVEMIPQQITVGNKILLALNDQITKAGFYSLKAENADTAQLLALNYNRSESNMQLTTAEQLKAQYPQANVHIVNAAHTQLATVIKELDRGTPLWKLCIALTLLFLAIEIALLRWWKV